MKNLNLKFASLILALFVDGFAATVSAQNQPLLKQAFVNTIFSADGKTFLTQDANSRYAVWKTDGSLLKQFADRETTVAAISAYVKPLGIEYPATAVSRTFVYTKDAAGDRKDSAYLVKINGAKVVENAFAGEVCFEEYYVAAREIGVIRYNKKGVGGNFYYLVRPNKAPEEISFGGKLIATNFLISPDGKILVDGFLGFAFDLENKKLLWQSTESAGFSLSRGILMPFPDEQTPDYSFTFSPDSKFLGLGERNKGIVISLTDGAIIKKNGREKPAARP